MFNIQAQALIQEVLESFALVGKIPIAIYEKDSEGKTTLIAHADESHFPRHCQELWTISDGERRCEQDMLERASEGFHSARPIVSHAGLTTEIHPIIIDDRIIVVLQFGAFVDPDENDHDVRLDLHRRLMNTLEAKPELAEHIRELLGDETLRRVASEREWLRCALPLVIEQVIYRHLRDRSQQMEEQRQGDEIRTAAYHDVQLRLQAALAHAADHLEEIKEPTARSWYLQESAERVVNSIELAGTVLHNLMRGEYLPEDYHFENLDLRDILAKAMSIAHPLAQQKNINIQHEIEPVKMRIMLQASTVHLQQAFNNLMHNAVKYSYRASKYGGRHIMIRGFYAEHGYKIVINNFGVGILEEEYEKIFEPGYKGKLRENEYRTGSGLGLSLTKQIIEKHQGRICVKSIPKWESPDDKSHPYLTEFTVWLPLTQVSRAQERRS